VRLLPRPIDAPNPGCLVLVEVEFAGADEARQRRWVDAVLDALDSETDPPTGGIAGHFHLSIDGTRAINYAEWVDEQAHRQAIEASGEGTVNRGPKWRLLRDFPGIKSSQVTRFHLIHMVSAQESMTEDAA
jgi:Antibiotic biosynthesis monooxygenase